MIGKVFVDSNILIYAHDVDAGSKQERAATWLRHLWELRTGRLSTQVLQEFYVNVTLKIKKPLRKFAAREVVRNYAAWVESSITPATVLRASEIGENWRLSFWDGMILAAAEQDQAAVLLTEDLTHGQAIAGVRIVNPFLQPVSRR
jgi:predicted nucleic acid-binding protein